MKFTSADKVETTCWTLKLADLTRSENRARIDSLFNGNPPYSEAEAKQNNIDCNVNFLDSTRLAHDMRRQYYNAHLKPGNFFKVTTDYGPKHRRQEIGSIITEEINRQMKRGRAAQQYRETKRNKFAQTVIHGVGPVAWKDREMWCPTMHQMCDVLIPSGTLLTMENLGHFAIYKRFTVAELSKLTSGPHVDEAWQMDTVNAAIKWAMKDCGQTVSATDTMSPELIQEAIKGDRGFYALDSIPTINCYDFYFLDDEGEEHGWRRRMVLDTPSVSEVGTQNILGSKNQFLYKPKDERVYATKLSEIINFQFADGSVVAPFRYHSVRSLGFLLYAVCHLQNRLRCKFNDSVFESLLNYFRSDNPVEGGRAQLFEMLNLGVVPPGVSFVPRNDRWQVDQNLVQMATAMNRQSMADNSTSYTQDFAQNSAGTPEKTATQIMAEVNASTALVGSMLNDSYAYEEFEYREDARRFCMANSRDPDVRAFRVACLKRGVPSEALSVDCWDISAERVIGAGNKQLEGAMAQSLLSKIDRYDPDAQREILRIATFADTDDAALTNILVPAQPNLVTDSVHDAQLSASTLLMGMLMGLKQGVNHGEYAATLIGALGMEVQKVNARGGVATQEEIAGMQNLAGQTIEGEPIQGNGAANHIAILAQNEDAPDKTLVKQLGDELSKLMNEVRAYQQRLLEQQQQPEGGGQPPIDPESAVKLKSSIILAEAKAQNMRQSHDQRSQQKQQIHEQNLQQKADKARLDAGLQIQQTEVDTAATDITTAATVQREAAKPPKPAPTKST